MVPQLSLAGRIAVVTGASRKIGIGAAICRALAEAGADVFFTYWTGYDKTMPWGVDEDEPARLQEEIRSCGVRCERVEVDLSDPQALPLLLDSVEERLGAPAILVNNACYSVNDGYEQLTAELLDAHYAVNVRATALLSAEFARRFGLGQGGRIINLATGQAQAPMIGEIAYASTKAAVETFTRILAAEVANKGITVNAVNPGPTDTGWMNDELTEHLLPHFPMGRVGQPQDAARLVRFLASDEAEWVTGQIIHSEGGFLR
ncbi:oxidoreductase [Tumebacillus avium]|uniref:Oxidoreductase n=1 Tax=Tumebacillus avium TaxID=1903704 RepID=A0A1Y0IPD1_9BACL|nr:SDR family oxidoreductase [Tumebacillus avium]ARU61213.1 oxidoreductase [Tumebacillus avium]